MVAARAGTLGQADVICAALAGAGIPVFIQDEIASNFLAHLGLAIHPWGIKILVPASEADHAREIVEQARPHPPPEREPLTPDDYAERAYRAALFWYWFTPMSLLMTYYLLRAILASWLGPVEQPKRFARHITLALAFGLVGPGSLAAGVWFGGGLQVFWDLKPW